MTSLIEHQNGGVRQAAVQAAGLLTHDALSSQSQYIGARLNTRDSGVRAAALRHERESLTEHMELLEEHLARLKADLEYKQSEVSEVAHQWEAAKAKLPALRQRQAGSEQMRANLQQIVAVLKAHLLKHNKNKLPKQLLQQLDLHAVQPPLAGAEKLRKDGDLAQQVAVETHAELPT